MKWFFMAGPGGSVAIKARYPMEAKQAAADRWTCDIEEIAVIDEQPYTIITAPDAATSEAAAEI